MDKGANRIEQELSTQPAIQAALMETMGAVYTSLGLYDQAVSLLRSALDKRRALFGAEDIEVARSMHRLGDVLKLKAEYEPALQIYRDALAIRQKLLGDDNVDTASSKYELADLLGRMGNFRKPSHCTARHWRRRKHCLAKRLWRSHAVLKVLD